MQDRLEAAYSPTTIDRRACSHPMRSRSHLLSPVHRTPSNMGRGTQASSEAELIVCCARTRLAQQHAERIQALVRGSVDWSTLVGIAREQRLISLVYAGLNATCPQEVPRSVLAGMRETRDAMVSKNLLLSRELLDLLEVFQRAGVRVLPAKGAHLAVAAYGGLDLRPFNDLDLVVNESAVPAAQEVLLSQGYTRGWSDAQWEHKFDHAGRGVSIDLHHRLAPAYFPNPASFDALWQDRTPVPLLNSTVLGMAPEHLLLCLGVDLAKDCLHGKPRMLQVCDVAELIRAHPRLEWVRVQAIARETGGERILLLALQLARQLLGATLPPELVDTLRTNRAVDGLAADVAPQLFRGRTAAASPRLDWRFYLRARERLVDKVRYLSRRALGPVRSVISPTESDRRFLRLPPALGPLYWLVRPLRILRDRLGGKRRPVRAKR